MQNTTREVGVTVNGKFCSVPEGITIAALLDRLALARTGIAVEVNRALVKKECYDSCRLREGDVVEIVTFVGGG